MRTIRQFTCLAVFAVTLLSAASASAQIQYGEWEQTEKGNFIRKCELPGGGHQYLVLLANQPQWIYWYNPVADKFWCRCPTVKHPLFGLAVAHGVDLFLIATSKADTIGKTQFPNNPGPAFLRTTAIKNKKGVDIDVGCPPTDLPKGV